MRHLHHLSFIQHFFTEENNGSYHGLPVQIIDFCNPNDPEAHKIFWMFHLDTTAPKKLNLKRTN